MFEEMNRREFMQKTALATAAASLTSASYSRIFGANDKLNIAIIGCGRMGRFNLGVQQKIRQVNVAAVCDVYEPNLQQALKMTGGKATGYRDFRKILERQDIDAVLIATPDHWHALMTTLACEANKDVFVEKPASVTISEGRRMVQVARRTGRIVQVGTMQRSSPVFQNAVKIVQSGALGDISFVRTWIMGNEYPDGIGNPPD